jgi:hypothetical protein
MLPIPPGRCTTTVSERGVKQTDLRKERIMALKLFSSPSSLATAETNLAQKITDIINSPTRETWWQGTSGNDVFNGKGTNDVVLGGDGDDILFGDVTQNGDLSLGNTSSNDRLFGGNGNDRLYGGAGNDQLDGGNGNDVLGGGQGADILTGGAGRDVFQIEYEHGGAHDRITDFTQGQDKIDLSSIDANLKMAGDQGFYLTEYDPNVALQAGQMTYYYDEGANRTVVMMEMGLDGNNGDIRLELDGYVQLTQDDFIN